MRGASWAQQLGTRRSGRRRPALAVAVALTGLALAGGARPEESTGPSNASGQTVGEDEWRVADEWVVTGTRLRDGVGDAPFQSSVLTGERLDLGISASVSDALRFVPGLHLVQEGAPGGRAQLALRGLDPNHVVVLVDGVRVNDPINSRGGSFDPSTLALVDLDRVEIVRGPLSSIYGADALAGVVQIVTRGVEPDDELRTRVRARGGRFHMGEVVGQASAGLGGVAGLSLGAGLNTSRDPHSDGGFDAASFHARLRVPLPSEIEFETFTRVHASSARAFPESSGGPELATLRAMEDRDVREISVGVSVARPFFSEAAHVRLLASRAARREDLDSPGVVPLDPDGFGVPASRAGDEYERWDVSLIGDGELPAFGGPVFSLGTRIVAGVEGVWEDGESDTSLALAPPDFIPFPFYDTRRTLSVFGEFEQPLGSALVISGSARFDSTPDEEDRVSPSIGLASEIPDTPFSVFGRYGEGFRRPSFYALHNPIVGNDSLEIERSRGWEAGFRYQGFERRLAIALGYFDIEVEDLHDFDAVEVEIVNRGRLVSRGVELELALQPQPAIELVAALSFNPTDFRSTRQAPLNRPRWRGFAELHARPLARWDFLVRVLAVGSSKASAAAIGGRTITLAGYERVDVRAAWTPIPGFDVFLEIENLTDDDYREAVGFESPGIAPRVGFALSR